ncbi:MAG: TIGR03435 family protein [Acidobacteriia bacterium]|nr:TIGR03435 family protein [Terriglobia bacterium]
MKKRGLLAGGILILAVRAFGQTAPAPTFEVASIKPSKAEPRSISGVTSETGRISARNVTLRRCIRGAYNVPETQVLGGPKWIDDERYDIDAKAAGPAGDHDLMIMLQSLLAERFKLVFHREKRPMSGYALVVGKSGLKAQRSTPEAHSFTHARRGGIDAQACTMANLAQKLSDALHLPVADFTGVEGAFDIKLEWTPEDTQAKPPAGGDKAGTLAPDGAAGPSIFAALQEQLGLKLESRKVPTEVLVIDRADKASEN